MPQPATKIAFLIQGHTAPSTRVRILNLLPYFHAAGFETAVEVYPNSLGGWRQVAPQLRGAEILVVQKRLPSVLEAVMLRWRMKRLVFDFDDSVWLRNREGDARPSNKLQRRFASLMKRADLAICGNPILEARVRATCATTRTVVIPSAVPEPLAAVPVRANSPLRVGWVGTAINLPYLTAIESALAEVQARVPFELVVICNKPPAFRDFPHVRFVPWSQESEYAEIAQFDAGIMPLADNEHSRGKCAYKALQYMSCGVPVVASDVGVNREWIAGAGAGLVVKEDGWRDALVTVLSDAAGRARFGDAGIASIRGGFRQEDVAARYVAAFRGLLGGGGNSSLQSAESVP
jgi:glycosyltransferase involved in cell wall biosynthesis